MPSLRPTARCPIRRRTASGSARRRSTSTGAGAPAATALDVSRGRRRPRCGRAADPPRKLAGGFSFTEGPVWVPAEGTLLFSDPNDNRIYRWSPDHGVSVFRTKSGYTGTDIGEYRQPGSNGLALDAEGRLTIAEHGNRRVTRLETNGDLTVLADRYEGKRLNSPNDLVYRSDGALYFTDPPLRPARRSSGSAQGTALHRRLSPIGRTARSRCSPRTSRAPTAWPSRPTSAPSTSPTGTSTARSSWPRTSPPTARSQRPNLRRYDGGARGGRARRSEGRSRRQPLRSGPGGLWIFGPTAGIWARSVARARGEHGVGRR